MTLKVETKQDTKFRVVYDNIEGKPLDEKDKVEIVIIGEKVNKHFYTKFNSAYDYQLKIDEKEFKIDKLKLLKHSKTALESLKSFLHIPFVERIREKYIVFFKEDTTNLHEVTFATGAITSRLAYTVINANVVKRGIASLFRERFNLPLNAKTFIMIGVVVAVGAIMVYGYMNGWFAGIMGGPPA